MGKTINGKTILLLVAGLFLAAVVLPMGVLLFDAIFQKGSVAVENFTSIFHKDVLQSIGNSLIISTAVSMLSVLTGCCFAFLFSKATLPFSKSLRLLLLLPCYVSRSVENIKIG